MGAWNIERWQWVITEAIRQIFWPDGFSNKIGRVLSGLSLLGLLTHGLKRGLGPVFAILLAYYENLLGTLFGWAEPFINTCLDQIQAYIGWPLVLYPHWKHIFVLLGIYFFRELGLSARRNGAATAISQFIRGLLVALAASASSGVIPPTGSDQVANFLIAAIPVLGAVIYAVIGNIWDATFLRQGWAKERHEPIPTWWAYFRHQVWRIISRSIVGLLLLWVGLQVSAIRELPSPGLAMLAALVIMFGFYWLVDGAIDSAHLRQEGESRWAAYLRSSRVQLGIAILSSFFWIGIFLLMNAGLSLFGL
jgi:hypothetical protein